jgi:hypothetical protein
MPTIAVSHSGGDTYRVEVTGSGSTTTHDVVVTDAHVEKYAAGSDKAALVRASFGFLLDREPKESILSRFELSVIERYFPEFPRRLSDYLET